VEIEEPGAKIAEPAARVDAGLESILKALQVPEFAPVREVEAPQPAVVPAEVPKVPPPRAFERTAEEERQHADAKRFARLLVSEIKLYNEQRVVEGRHNRDLYGRLKRDIDRSREMYEKRVSLAVARQTDYFHDEVVRILGDNDPSVLGTEYPGPRVQS